MPSSITSKLLIGKQTAVSNAWAWTARLRLTLVIWLVGVKLEETTEKRDHDFGTDEKYIPCGIVDEDSGQLHLIFGSSSKTSDFMVDALYDWWNDLWAEQQQQIQQIQLKVDNGSESSGIRTQFLKRMVEFVDCISKPIHLLYYPPYHSKYNPTLAMLGNFGKALEWSQADGCSNHAPVGKKYDKRKGTIPEVKLNLKTYERGISLTKKAMRVIERRLEGNPLLPKWDILIRPVWLPDW